VARRNFPSLGRQKECRFVQAGRGDLGPEPRISAENYKDGLPDYAGRQLKTGCDWSAAKKRILSDLDDRLWAIRESSQLERRRLVTKCAAVSCFMRRQRRKKNSQGARHYFSAGAGDVAAAAVAAAWRCSRLVPQLLQKRDRNLLAVCVEFFYRLSGISCYGDICECKPKQQGKLSSFNDG
jgi:hypothetical protein